MSSSSTTWTKDTNTKSGTVNISEQTVSTLRITATNDNDAILELFADNADENADKWRMWVNDADDDLHFSSYATGSWADLLTIQDTGNVGIGVSAANAPASKLHVAGTVQVGVDDTGHDVKFFGDAASRYWLWDTSADGVVQRGTLTVGVDGTGHDVVFYSDTSGDNLTWDASEEVLQITGTNGQTSLDVLDGDLRVVDKIYLYDRGGEYIYGDGTDLRVYSGADILLVPTGNVGIGTATPECNLSIYTSAATTIAGSVGDATTESLITNMDGSGLMLHIHNYYNDVDDILAGMKFQAYDAEAAIACTYDATNTASLVFGTSTTANTIVERMRIDSTGKVGIGLTPTANMVGLSIEAGCLTLKERATPTADTDYGKIYTKTDNKLYFQDGAGTEHEIAFV